MRPSNPMPHRVGDLMWPVVSVSSLRLYTDDKPAEFIVLVDRCEATRTNRARRCPCWSGRTGRRPSTATTTCLAQTQRGLVERAGLRPMSTVEVVTVRDSGMSNDYTFLIGGQTGLLAGAR